MRPRPFCALPAVAVALALTSTLPSSFPAAGAPAPGSAQLGAPLEWVRLPGDPARRLLVQKTRDGTLVLTPNESFFPAKALKAAGEGAVPDMDDLNGGHSFAEITGWDRGDAAEWGLWFPERGDCEIAMTAEGNGRFALALGGQTQQIGGGRSTNFRIDEPGFHVLRLTCEKADSGIAVRGLEVSGPAAKEAAVVRKRWRPAAAHARFTSARAPEGVRLWVMEMDAVPGALDFYSPITTPFGYYGPSWKADGTVDSSFNFSLWSFARGAAEPPIAQLSHLLAIGNPDATFGGFDHEGTGVKIRNWEPLAGKQGQRQALALRVAPGETYDTYFSYFFDPVEKRWRLFGAGNKFNKGKPLENLWVGSFVEVPGPPPVQRTGPYERTMRYRGWVMDASRRWHALDTMKNGNVDKNSGLTHTNRGVTEDGWFFLQTGGWNFREPPNRGEDIVLRPTGKPEVDFLDPDDLEFLQTLPCEITATALERHGDRARVSFTVRNAGREGARVIAHWGSEEGLTLAQRWPHTTELTGIREGENQHVLEGIHPGAPLRLRLLLVNEEGQFWTRETIAADP